MDGTFLAHLLSQEGREFALFDAQQKLYSHSMGLKGYLMVPPAGDLSGERITDLFPELTGYESQMVAVQVGQQAFLKIERIHRHELRGRPGYITLLISTYQDGWMLVLRDVTGEGELEQKVTQQRNELSLLANQLTMAQLRLDELLRRFVPTTVVDHMLADHSKAELGGERREITVLFADLRGFTSWSETQDPESVMDVLNQTLSGAVRILLEAGATLDKFMGDALMAVFNAPIQQSNHASLALQCAWEISQIQIGQDDQLPRFGIGVNTGQAVVGNIGTMDAMNYTALGDAVNVAKRLEEMTRPGEVLIGPRTHALADPTIERCQVGDLEIRGRKQHLQVYQVTQVPS